MPELPEVETIRRDLRREILYKKIINIQINLSKLIKSPNVLQFTSILKGKSIIEVDRRGKYIICYLDCGYRLIFHLGMSGLLFYQKKNTTISTKLKNKHTHLVFHFDDESRLIYNDIRQFGKIWLIKQNEEFSRIENLGKEPLEDEFTFEEFLKVFRNKKGSIKSLLMDQKNIAGIGNIYASEILFMAALHPMRKVDTLDDSELKKLYYSIKKTLAKAIAARGMTLKDESYRDLLGEYGKYREEVMVYGKKENYCPRCGNTISVMKIDNRSTYFCSKCQS